MKDKQLYYLSYPSVRLGKVDKTFGPRQSGINIVPGQKHAQVSMILTLSQRVNRIIRLELTFSRPTVRRHQVALRQPQIHESTFQRAACSWGQVMIACKSFCFLQGFVRAVQVTLRP